MGNSSAEHQFNKQQWVEVISNQSVFGKVNPHSSKMLMNIITKEIVEQYNIRFIGYQDYTEYVKDLAWRKRSNINNKITYIYPIQYFIDTSQSQMCSIVYSGKAYIKKVELRLREINEIPFEDAIYMYEAMLKGFRVLFQKVGCFNIHDDMIFIDEEGLIKVWMNSQLSKNYPEQTINQTNQAVTESQMINQILNIIEDNLDKKHSQTFSSFLTTSKISHTTLKFDTIQPHFRQYAKKNKLRNSGKMISIAQLMMDENSFEIKRQKESSSRPITEGKTSSLNTPNKYDYNLKSNQNNSLNLVRKPISSHEIRNNHNRNNRSSLKNSIKKYQQKHNQYQQKNRQSEQKHNHYQQKNRQSEQKHKKDLQKDKKSPLIPHSEDSVKKFIRKNPLSKYQQSLPIKTQQYQKSPPAIKFIFNQPNLKTIHQNHLIRKSQFIDNKNYKKNNQYGFPQKVITNHPYGPCSQRYIPIGHNILQNAKNSNSRIIVKDVPNYDITRRHTITPSSAMNNFNIIQINGKNVSFGQNGNKQVMKKIESNLYNVLIDDSKRIKEKKKFTSYELDPEIAKDLEIFQSFNKISK